MELLAPAGDYEALVAAISNGADAIYLGLSSFGARAYAKNFNYDELEKAIKYAHLRQVKIYVTMNTNVYENELNEVYKQIDFLASKNVDGIIFFDLAVLEYIKNNYPKLEAHASTQIGIDSVNVGMFFKNNNVDRIVLARELNIDKIKEIKNKVMLPIEIFIHGALCISYSGNCLMSGLIGLRSGNRGRCVGSCRKIYQLIDKTNNISFPPSYLLSTKDLKTIENINKLDFVDSLKIEGRMKDPTYVANVVKCYRKAIDDSSFDLEKANYFLNKTFQRTFTKGYLFNEEPVNITNIERPNNYGYLIGKVVKVNKNKITLKLNDKLNQNDQIRIFNKEDIIYPIVKMYDEHNNLINSSKTSCILEINEKVNINDKVYKVKDYNFNEYLKTTYNKKEFKKFPINFYVNGNLNNHLEITINYNDIYITEKSNEIITSSINLPITKEKILEQLEKLTETPYYIDEFICNIDDNMYISIKEINNLRRILIEKLNIERLKFDFIKTNKQNNNSKISYPLNNQPKLACYATTLEQLEVIKEENIDIIYDNNNFIRRNQTEYNNKTNDYLLVGGYGGINYYKNNYLISDYSLNVTNSKAIYKLHSNGVKRITISHELNKNQINEMINAYYNENNGYPNLEMIVYGKATLMFTKYCPLKKFNLCGKCKTNKYVLKDNIAEFPIISHYDCATSILNSRALNLIDDLEDIKNINVFRLQFTTESKEETRKIIKEFKEKINNINNKTNYFNQNLHTRGHFNKQIL